MMTDTDLEINYYLDLIQEKISIETCKECPHFKYKNETAFCMLFIPDKNTCLIIKEDNHE